MEKKRKSQKQAVKPAEVRVTPSLEKPQTVGIKNKDKQILDDVQNIIWNPSRLDKFKPAEKPISKEKRKLQVQ